MKTLARHFTAFLLVLFLSVSLTQCSGLENVTGGTEVGSPSVNDDPEASIEDPADEENDIPTTTFTTLAQGTDGDLGLSARKQIFDAQDELQTHWELLFPGETAPVIDFSQFHVAFLVMGEQSSGGNAIEISSIEMTDIDFDMMVTVTSASGDCTNTQALNNPYHIVQIDKASQDLRRHFVTENIEQSCE